MEFGHKLTFGTFKPATGRRAGGGRSGGRTVALGLTGSWRAFHPTSVFSSF